MMQKIDYEAWRIWSVSSYITPRVVSQSLIGRLTSGDASRHSVSTGDDVFKALSKSHYSDSVVLFRGNFRARKYLYG